MTETFTESFASPRLERPVDGGLKGVSVALARTTGTDVVLWRVLFVITSFFGGLGVVLYLLGVVMIPKEGEAQSVGDRLLHGPDRHLSGRHLVLVVLVVLGVAGLLSDSDGGIAAAVLAALAVLWWHQHREGSATSVTAAPRPATREVPVYAAVPREPVRRSPFTGLTLSVAVLVAGALVLIGVAGGASMPAEVVLASTLAVLGLGLVVGSFFGRSTGLVVMTLLLGLGLAATAAARPAIDHGIGDRTWHPSGSGSYRLGIGDATLDLRSLNVTEAATYRIDARVDVGHLLVLVPQGIRTSVDARASIGDVVVFGQEDDGQHARKTVEPDGRPQVVLALSVRTGQVEVRRG